VAAHDPNAPEPPGAGPAASQEEAPGAEGQGRSSAPWHNTSQRAPGEAPSHSSLSSQIKELASQEDEETSSSDGDSSTFSESTGGAFLELAGKIAELGASLAAQTKELEALKESQKQQAEALVENGKQQTCMIKEAAVDLKKDVLAEIGNHDAVVLAKVQEAHVKVDQSVEKGEFLSERM